MMKRVNFFRALPLATLLLVLASCNKDQVDTQLEAVTDDLKMLQAEQISAEDADKVSLKCPECDIEEMHSCLGGDSCAQITDTGEGAFPRTITIDYGSGCGEGRHQKKGKIIIVVSADMSTSGAVRTVTFENFSAGDHQMSGTRTLTNMSAEATANPVFAYSDNLEMTHRNRTRQVTASGTRTWIAGFDTKEDRTDDIFETSGSSTMTCDKGQGSREIVEPIVFDASCGHPVSGIVTMTDPEGHTHTINFGDGTCDNEATITHDDGTTETINLDEMRPRGRGRHRHHGS